MGTSLYMTLFKAFHAYHGLLGPLMAEEGLSPGQPKLLHYLRERDHCLQKELAAACGIEPATVSKMLSAMEEAGLIRRDGVEGDRRAVAVSITPKGEQISRRMGGHFASLRQQALKGFTPEEEDELRAYLRRMYQNLTGREME